MSELLETDLRQIGEKLYTHRKKTGLTQSELAELAGVSDRTYADIERGSTTMRIDTLVKICGALHITPDAILVKEKAATALRQEELFARLSLCDDKSKATAMEILDAFLRHA